MDEIVDELIRRWRSGDKVPCEQLISRSDLNQEQQLELICTELLIRRERGDAPTLDEFRTRFPQYHKELAAHFALENLLSTEVIAGRYVLQQKIGEGGMGEVWVARQTEPIKRKVALKLIKTGMDSKAVLQRFEQERQALGIMDHPNIARVLDGGLTPTGQPFFVMELVNGLPLNKFCDEARLTLRQRLELFVPICQAVQHAHQKGIVHRDLKPANILVTMIDATPVPKVIDFGVAKATSGKLTDETMSTQFGAVMGTLEYMSPEQAGYSGDDIDTRADIYSLGVILYELLTGLRPIDGKRLKKGAVLEMIRIIREEDPSKPSLRLSTDESLPSLAAIRQMEPRKLMSLLRGELDWVVMKCLEKQRERRYETANALARDIQRYLADEEVEARPPSAGYRLGKFVRRNKGLAAAALMMLLSLTVLTLLVAFFWVKAQRDQADVARNQALKQTEIAFLVKEEAIREREFAEAAKINLLEEQKRLLVAREKTNQKISEVESANSHVETGYRQRIDAYNQLNEMRIRALMPDFGLLDKDVRLLRESGVRLLKDLVKFHEHGLQSAVQRNGQGEEGGEWEIVCEEQVSLHSAKAYLKWVEGAFRDCLSEFEAAIVADKKWLDALQARSPEDAQLAYVRDKIVSAKTRLAELGIFAERARKAIACKEISETGETPSRGSQCHAGWATDEK